jgi:NADH-quinone oxidoreductase subunit M
MNEPSLSWVELAVAVPLLGALLVGRLRDLDRARHWAGAVTGLTLCCAIGAWGEFQLVDTSRVAVAPHLTTHVFGWEIFDIDQLSAPLLPLTALLYFLTAVTTLRTKMPYFSFALTLFSESIALATFSCRAPWLVIGLLGTGTVLPYLELVSRGRPTRVYIVHAALFVGLMVLGQSFVGMAPGPRGYSLWAIIPLLLAILVRSGIAPFHCWMTDLFEHASFATALLFVTPIAGAYAAVRLVLPIAPDWVLRSMGLVSLATAVYTAGMALIQRDARRFFCFIFLSHSALVLVGLEMVTPLGLTGALCVWLSVGLAMGGFGLTLRALESRIGRLSLADFQGLYDQTPNLAMCFVLTGLASVGFPGTFGFVGTELLVDGAVEAYLSVGVAVVLAAALNGIAVVKAYFLLFTGTRHVSSVSLRIRIRERYAVLGLAAIILIGGFFPQPGVVSRQRAADEILHARTSLVDDPLSFAAWPSPSLRTKTRASAW